MAYIHATPAQIDALKRKQEELITATRNLEKRKTAEYTTASFLQGLSGLPFPGAWDVQNALKWPDTEMNELFYKKFPSYAGHPEYITRKMIVSVTAPNTDPAYNDRHNSWFQRAPFGGTEFLNEVKAINNGLKQKYTDEVKEKKDAVIEYEKFLEDQDIKKDDVIATAGITATVTNFNRAIDDITSDPKKIALYIGVAIVVIIILFIVIKNFVNIKK